jgi:heavy metal sensor kinase
MTLWFSLAFLAALTGFAVLVYTLLWHALYRQVDRSLASGFDLLRSDPRLQTDPDGRLAYWVEEFKEHQNIYCAIFRSDGSVRAWHPDLPVEGLEPPRVGPSNRWEQTMTLGPLGRQRGLAERVRAADQELIVLLLAPLADADRELADILGVLLIAGPVMVLASGALAYTLARQALAPMDALRRSTDAITADRLDRRLPVLNPHDELGRLSRTINAMIGRLEKAFAEVRRFTADASHELRTPVTLIRMEAEVGFNNPPGPEGCQQLLGNILEECGHITHLTDQLLTLAREDAKAGGPAAEPLDLSRLVGEVAESLRPMAEFKGLHMQVAGDRPVWVVGNPARLRQVFLNIIDNALKYTPDGGRVDVEVRAEGNKAVAAVRDSGIGIPPEHLPHVFDRFYRVDKARSRSEGGTGLGLSIAQSIIAAHGGQIELASTPGRGTRCTVTLPVQGNSA